VVKVNAVNVFATDHAAAQKTGRLVIQLLADLFPDAAPALRRGFHWVGINHLFHDGQVVGQPGCAFLAGTNGGRLRHGHGHHHLRRGGWRQLQEQLQLGRVKLLAAGAKHPPHQQINLLPQELILPP
jgi:hypothetical protein